MPKLLILHLMARYYCHLSRPNCGGLGESQISLAIKPEAPEQGRAKAGALAFSNHRAAAAVYVETDDSPCLGVHKGILPPA